MTISQNDVLTAIDIVALVAICAGAAWSALTQAIPHGLRGALLLGAVALCALGSASAALDGTPKIATVQLHCALAVAGLWVTHIIRQGKANELRNRPAPGSGSGGCSSRVGLAGQPVRQDHRADATRPRHRAPSRRRYRRDGAAGCHRQTPAAYRPARRARPYPFLGDATCHR